MYHPLKGYRFSGSLRDSDFLYILQLSHLLHFRYLLQSTHAPTNGAIKIVYSVPCTPFVIFLNYFLLDTALTHLLTVPKLEAMRLT